MELRFRPKDAFCKVVTSTSNFTPGILLKIRVKKKKQNAASSSSEGPTVIATEVVGVVKIGYSFDGEYFIPFLFCRTLIVFSIVKVEFYNSLGLLCRILGISF